MIPPRKFSLPDADLNQDVFVKLARLGYVTPADVQKFRNLLQKNGEIPLLNELARLEQIAQGYSKWFPRLRVFAAACRRQLPAPFLCDLAPAEREEHRILRAKMTDFITSEGCHRLFDCIQKMAIIFVTTPAALGAAEEVFGRIDSGVVLTEEELQRWFSEVYEPASYDHWWYWIKSWTVVREFDAPYSEIINRDYPAPEGSENWDVVSGSSGGAVHDLWRWNGTRAEFIESYCIDTY
ncbi:MAG TPA: hypothetical protein VGM05_32710 [Planctomycetaceae bacterium]